MGYNPKETQVHEKISSMIVRYNGRVAPVKFLWRGSAYYVQSVNTEWVDKQSTPFKRFYSVTTQSNGLFMISYTDGDKVWWVESIVTD